MRRKSKGATVKKDIEIQGHKFALEIYLALEGVEGICWEIFPRTIEASNYAFSNKKEVDKEVAEKYIYD